MASLLKGFKEFAFKGDLITAAVGLVMALATFTLVQTIVEGLITPIILAIFGEENVFDLSFTINNAEFAYGAVISAAIMFVGTAAAVYFLIVLPYKHYQAARGAPVDSRPCPECTTSISVAAKRCPHCTSSIVPAS
jgi:large conductance mechanosensitive channel